MTNSGAHALTDWLQHLRQVPVLLRGEPERIGPWIEQCDSRRVWVYVAVVIAGAGLYGAAMGWWRAPVQALYTATKFPLLILLTTLGNAMLNGMLAPLLGLNISLRQSLLLVLISFTIAASILGSFSPPVLFLVWNTPSTTASVESAPLAYSFMQLTHVALIAFAGTVANVRLFPLLRELSKNQFIAYKVLFAWLAGNLFLGSQICWVLRPFIGDPRMQVEFLGSHPFQGSLYETVFEAARNLLAGP